LKQISIIIPVYNSEKFIAKCLDSIINQLHCPLIEIILIDDGSKDNTPDIIKGYSKKYSFIKVITQENQKQSAARNNGLKHATGKYVMFIDSDDYLEKTMLSDMYNLIEMEKTDLCICGIKKIFNSRVELEIESCLKKSGNHIGDFLTKHKEMDVGLWNKIFKLDIIQKNNLNFENGNFFEDTLFVFKYLCNISQGISFLEKPLYNLLKREESTTTTYNPSIEYYAIKLNSKVREYIKIKQLDKYIGYLPVLQIRNMIHIIHHNMKFNNENREEKIKEILAEIDYKFIFTLPLKYKLALVFLKSSPNLYERLYLRKKNV